MRFRAALRFCVSILCALALASLGVTEFDPHPESPGMVAVEDHFHDTEVRGHCHPGLDCAAAVIFVAAHLPEVTPARHDTPHLPEARLNKGWRLTNDPPPPRYVV